EREEHERVPRVDSPLSRDETTAAGHRDARKDRADEDHDEQLDEGEAGTTSSHGVFASTRCTICSSVSAGRGKNCVRPARPPEPIAGCDDRSAPDTNSMPTPISLPDRVLIDTAVGRESKRIHDSIH